MAVPGESPTSARAAVKGGGGGQFVARWRAGFPRLSRVTVQVPLTAHLAANRLDQLLYTCRDCRFATCSCVFFFAPPPLLESKGPCVQTHGSVQLTCSHDFELFAYNAYDTPFTALYVLDGAYNMKRQFTRSGIVISK